MINRKVLIHESGRKTMIITDGNGIEEQHIVTYGDGREDKVISEIEVNKMNPDDFRKSMCRPQQFNPKKYRTAEEKVI